MVDLFVEWYVFEIPGKIKKIWGNYAWFFAKYFALADLLRDLFAPWKGLTFAREKRGFDFGDMIWAASGNLISRILGAIVRLFFIVAGLVVQLVTAVLGVFAYVFWIGLIPLIFFAIWRGVYLLLIS